MKSLRLVSLIVAAAVAVSACQPSSSAENPAPRSEATVRPPSTPRPTAVPTERPTPTGDLFAPPDGAFTMIAPEGWEVRELAGFKYNVIIGPASSDFAPNLNFVDEAFAGSLEDYVAANEKTIAKLLPNAKVTGQFDMTTVAGEPMIKLTVEDTQYDRDLLQVFYFFDGGARKWVVTYSRARDEDSKWDDVVDAAMQTFTLGK